MGRASNVWCSEGVRTSIFTNIKLRPFKSHTLHTYCRSIKQAYIHVQNNTFLNCQRMYMKNSMIGQNFQCRLREKYMAELGIVISKIFRNRRYRFMYHLSKYTNKWENGDAKPLTLLWIYKRRISICCTVTMTTSAKLILKRTKDGWVPVL